MQAKNYPINKWAEDDRPREKLLSKNPFALSNSELLAILINNGTREKNALELAREILRLGDNNLDQLGQLSVKSMMEVKGIGKAKAITIVAALELGRRREANPLTSKKRVQSSKDVAVCLQGLLKDHNREVFCALYLNRSNKIKRFEILSEGGIASTIADPRMVLRRALESNAVNIVLCHNHPSGSLRPSRADEEITSKIQGAARYFDIKVIDHVIVSSEGYYSFADEGLI
jgi:DNA repair protein RadC